MKKIIGIVFIILVLFVGLFIIEKNINTNKIMDNDKFKIVTSFYPMYTIAKNLTIGMDDVAVYNMADKTVGCIHDYTLTTSDLKKLENCDVFIENGNGLEVFIDKVIETNKNLNIINASKNIIFDDNENEQEYEHEHEHVENAHIWISIDKYISEVNEIKNELIKLNPINENKYIENANKYLKKLEELKYNYENELKDIKDIKVISLNETYELMKENLKIDILTIETDHDESTLSANKLAQIIEKMKNENIKYIIIDKNDSIKNAETLKNETGAEILMLNSAMTGKDEYNSYLDAMRYNLDLLKKIK